MEAPALTTFSVRLDLLGPKGDVLGSHEFVKEKIVLGRILSADVRIDDPRVSRIHALLEIRGETMLLTDLASTHGTFVNGEKIVESKIKIGDTIRLGVIDLRVEKGSGKPTIKPTALSSGGSFAGEETQVDIDRSLMEQMDRREKIDRRQKDAFPEESRLKERREGDRRIDQRGGERRQPPPSKTTQAERRITDDRREPLGFERRVGEQRRSDRRLFDITSLERRIEERRARKSDEDLLPEELETAFEPASHARELEVTVLWGDHILDVSNYAHPVVLTVGENPRNKYIIPSVGIGDEFPLVTVEEDGNASLAFTDEMNGTVRSRDQIYNLTDLKKEKFVRRSEGHYIIGLKQDDFAKLSIGPINFFILYVKPAPRILPPPFFERDRLLLRTLIGSALLMLLLWVGVAFVPEPKPVTIEMVPERFARIIIKKRELPKDMVAAEQTVQGGSVKAEGGKPQEPEGKVGKPEKADKQQPAQAMTPKTKPVEKVTKPSVITPDRRKVVDAQKAKSVGLLKAFSQSGIQKDLKDLLDKDPGFDAFGKSVSGLKGRTVEEAGGAGGKGIKGVDVGGGGKTIGIDGPSTKGLGRGDTGEEIGEGLYGPGRLGQKGEQSVSIIEENVQVLSGLPKDLINAVVQRHRSEIRQCYEASRQRNPGLRGKVTIAFTIQPSGIVSYATVKESTVGDGALESCIVSRVRTWIFPKPQAPVETQVSAYPFYLNPAN